MENKETLEEAAEMYIQSKNPQWTPYHKQSFKDGAKWQQERSYSEEDIENIWNEFVKELPPINNGASSDFLLYLKQFKKK